MRRLGVAAAVVVALAVAVAVALPRVRGGAAPGGGALAALGRPDARAPDGVRVRVEVLNASRVQGLARRATFHLRDRGFDVLESGNAGKQLDSTLVIDRSGHPEWAQLVARAMGGAEVAEQPDSSRYLDVTVLVGASWRPPAEPFYP
ncbi:MAG TPA: LytR C-terminal domain-containing protein [Gemmatimonadaceae bacterium]|nr:LytR C-terminal domain-containing protein [Gemmatimonadaceae bacterium]